MVSVSIKGKKAQFYLLSAITIVISLSIITGFLRLPEEVSVSKMTIYEKAPLAFEKVLEFMNRNNLKLISEWSSLDRDYKKEVRLEENDNATLDFFSFKLDFPDDIDPNSIEVLKGTKRKGYIINWLDREEREAKIFIKDRIDPFGEGRYKVFANVMEPSELSYPEHFGRLIRYQVLDLTSYFNSSYSSSSCEEPNYTTWRKGKVTEGGVNFGFLNRTGRDEVIAKCSGYKSKQLEFRSSFIVDSLHFALASNATNCFAKKTTLEVNYDSKPPGNYSLAIPGYEEGCNSSVPYIQQIEGIGPGSIYHVAKDVEDGNITSLNLYENGSITLAAVTLEGKQIPRLFKHEAQSYLAEIDLDQGGIMKDIQVKRSGIDIAEDFFNLKIGNQGLRNSSADPIKLSKSGLGKVLGLQSNLPSALVKVDYILLPNLIKAEYSVNYKDTGNSARVIFNLSCEDNYTAKSGNESISNFCLSNTSKVINKSYLSFYNNKYSLSIYTNFSQWSFESQTGSTTLETNLVLDSSNNRVFFNTSTGMDATSLNFDLFLEFHKGNVSKAETDMESSYASPAIEKSQTTLEDELKDKREFLQHVYSRRGYSLDSSTKPLYKSYLRSSIGESWEINRGNKVPLKLINPLDFHTTNWAFQVPIHLGGRLNSLVLDKNLPYQLLYLNKDSKIDSWVEPPINYSLFSLKSFNVSITSCQDPNKNLNLSVYKYGEKINETTLNYTIENLSFSKGLYTLQASPISLTFPSIKIDSSGPNLIIDQEEFNITKGWGGDLYTFLPANKNQIKIKLNSNPDTYHDVYLRDSSNKVLKRLSKSSGQAWLNYSVENWKGGRFLIIDLDRNQDWINFGLSNLKLPSNSIMESFDPEKPKVEMLIRSSLSNNEVKQTGVYFSNQSFEDINFKTDLSVNESGLEINNTFYSLRFKEDFGWDNRTPVTIPSSKIDQDLKDFPLLINLTSSNFNFGKAQPDGDDIRITNSNNKLLDYEIEQWTGDHAQIWVEVPFVSSSQNTTLYIYYGNPKAEDAQDPDGVWNKSYTMVQHLEETSGTHYDSTQQDNDGTPNGGVTQDATWEVNGADDFDGTDDYVGVDGFSVGSWAMTASAWIKVDSFTGNRMTIISADEHQSGEDEQFVWSVYSDTYKAWISDEGDWTSVQGGNPTSGEWVHFVFTYDNETQRLYVNGNLIATNDAAGMYIGSPNPDITTIGSRSSEDRHWFNGTIDEVRVSDKARSQAWINTSYQNIEGNLVNYGTEESPSGLNSKQMSLKVNGKSWLNESGINAAFSKIYGDKDEAFVGFENLSITEIGPLRSNIKGKAANLQGLNYSIRAYSGLPLLGIKVEASEFSYDLTFKNWFSTGTGDKYYGYEGMKGEQKVEGNRIDLEELECPGYTWVGKRGPEDTVGVIFECRDLYPSKRTILIDNESISVSFDEENFTYYLVPLKGERGFKELDRYAKRLEYLKVKKDIFYTRLNLETPRLIAEQKLIT